VPTTNHITACDRAQLRRLAAKAEQAGMACAMEAEVLTGLLDLLDALEAALRNADRRLTQRDRLATREAEMEA
jgi:hypothetical protein